MRCRRGSEVAWLSALRTLICGGRKDETHTPGRKGMLQKEAEEVDQHQRSSSCEEQYLTSQKRDMCMAGNRPDQTRPKTRCTYIVRPYRTYTHVYIIFTMKE